MTDAVRALRRAVIELGRRFDCHLEDDVSTAFLALVPTEVVAAHDRRVTELLEANNREVERRREVQAELERVRMANVDAPLETWCFTDVDGTVRGQVTGRHDLLVADIAEMLARGARAEKIEVL